MINFITACVGGYDMQYANKAASMFKRHCTLDVSCYCITDRPGQLSAGITPIIPSLDVSGWWNKILAFGPDMPKGWTVVMDVDTVIVRDITEIIEYAGEKNELMAGFEDAIHWHGCKFTSSFMVFKSETLLHVYEKLEREWPTIENFPGGDQVWLYPQFEKVLFLDKFFPEAKQGLKYHLARSVDGRIRLPLSLPDSLKIIDFGGNPKPHEIANWPVITDHWR